MRIVSLFSGAGGLDLGLIKAGHKIIWANDIFADAVATYRKNIGNHIDDRNILNIPSSDIPECDVIVGGFPCQGFSVANRGRAISDERNQLYLEMVRIVKSRKPKFFIGENVKGMTSLGKGVVFKQILNDFKSAGYKVWWQVVNAADYGVPQLRMRLIIYGIRNDIEISPIQFPPQPTHAEPELSAKLGLEKWKSVGEALAHFPEPDSNQFIPNHEYSKYKLRFNGHLGHRFIDPTRPAPTVTSRGDDKGGVVVLHHPGNHRRMTARELAAVQSFPDDFIFVGTKTSAYRQISNAVPPLLGLAIGRMLLANEDAIVEKRQVVKSI